MRWGESSLWWLWILPVLSLLLFAYGQLIRRYLLKSLGHSALIRRLLESYSPERRLFKQLLLLLSICLLVLAALRPQYGRRPEPIRQTGIDLAVAFDISKSMLARDVAPSRLEAARGALMHLLGSLHGHRMALVPFAGVAFTQTPLTEDKSAIRLYLRQLDPQQMPVGGTNLSMAINQGVDLLTGKKDRGDRASRSRVLLLITDGEDASEDQGEAAKEAARKAAEAGVMLYTLAVGTRLGEPIPMLNEDGTHAGYQKGQDGKPIYSKLNLPLLKELTRLADPGQMEEQRVFVEDAQGGAILALGESLEHLQKSTMEGAIRHRHGEKFQYLILPALLLLLGDLLLGERRRWELQG